VNIWILDHYATSADNPGITRHYDFAEELIKQGCCVSIFASSFNHRTRREERLEGKQKYCRQQIDGVEFIWIRTSPYYGGNDRRRLMNMLSYSFRVITCAVNFKKKPDVILASSPHPFAGLAGYILAKIKRAQFIFEVRDLWPETFVEIGGYSRKSLVVRLLGVLEKFLYRRASKIVIVTSQMGDYIAQLGIPSDKTVCIPNGADPELFRNISIKLPKELAELISMVKSKGEVLVGYTGAHGIADALGTIVESAKLIQHEGISGIHFLLVGDGAEKERLMKKAENYGLNNITFYNSIPKNAIPALLKAIDIAVLTKKKSNLYRYGISFAKLFDYMMSARPIVFAVDSANNPIVETECGITVPPEQSEELAKAIVQLCNLSDEERQAMGIKGREYVMKYHSTPVLAHRLLEIMQDIKQK
jgi:glycosyltransferase involved in cell wall biosynthesis